MKEVKVIFENEAKAEMFFDWFYREGEQDYWRYEEKKYDVDERFTGSFVYKKEELVIKEGN